MGILSRFGLVRKRELENARKQIEEQGRAIEKQKELTGKQAERLEGFQNEFKKIEELSGIYKRRLSGAESEINKFKEAGYIFSGGDGEENYTELGTTKYDMNRSDLQEIQKQCIEIFKINPYAKRIIEMGVDFAIGDDDVTYTVEEEFKDKLEPILELFWNDYDNDIPKNLTAMAIELDVFGEQIYPIANEEKTRVVRLGHIDPRLVSRIMKNPDNGKRAWQVIVEPSDPTTDKNHIYGVLNDIQGKLAVDPAQRSPLQNDMRAGEYKTDCLLFQINKTISQTRGYSELMTMLDTLDLVDQFIFQVAERSLLLFEFLIHVTLKNTSAADVKKWRSENPKPSSYMVTNDKVDVMVMSPDLKAVDAETLVRTITRYAMAGAGIPEHWIVAGDNTNYATAKEQNTPIERRLERKQNVIRQMLNLMIRHQFEKYFTNANPALIRKYCDAVTINMPSVKGIDRKLMADILKNTATGLVMVTQQGWVKPESAAKSIVDLANTYGLDLEEEEFDEDMAKKTGMDNYKDVMKTLDDIKLNPDKYIDKKEFVKNTA